MRLGFASHTRARVGMWNGSERGILRMKKCRRCSKPATLHITEIRKGEVVEIHLCEVCAKDYLSQSEPTDASSPDFEFEKFEEAADQLEAIDDPVCENCGITFREFRKNGRLGCAHDYEAFRNDMIPLLENIHGETQHIGKSPRRSAGTSTTQNQLVRLKGQLKSAIDDERYEEAAKLRDEIIALEAELKGDTAKTE